MQVKQRPVFLSFINLFFSSRVMSVALRLALAACFMTKHERIGFMLIMINIAL